jgi:hypothetical protein
MGCLCERVCNWVECTHHVLQLLAHERARHACQHELELCAVEWSCAFRSGILVDTWKESLQRASCGDGGGSIGNVGTRMTSQCYCCHYYKNSGPKHDKRVSLSYVKHSCMYKHLVSRSGSMKCTGADVLLGSMVNGSGKAVMLWPSVSHSGLDWYKRHSVTRTVH